MAFSTKIAHRAPAVIRHGRRLPVALPRRQFTTATAPVYSKLLAQTRASQTLQKRNFTASAACCSVAATQEAPNPKAYLESGVIKPRDIVDVKKVLVIGSGGLAIGQAGEFDYSGVLKLFHPHHRPPTAGRSRVTHFTLHRDQLGLT
jgi:carbamoyl-phosphate synthase large subunit